MGANPSISMSKKQRKQAVRIGVITLAVLIGLFALTFRVKSIQRQRADQDFESARQAIGAVIKAGKMQPTPKCSDQIDAARKSMARQMRRTNLYGVRANTKAVVYDLVLKKAVPLCNNDPPPTSPEFSTCENTNDCRQQAIDALLTGHTRKAEQACLAALSKQEDRALRELLELIRAMAHKI